MGKQNNFTKPRTDLNLSKQTPGLKTHIKALCDHMKDLHEDSHVNAIIISINHQHVKLVNKTL